ncbi:endonuclease V (plasmid) [Fulvitalea axinellae]|uniref:Endonuclease V n=1 Tax=Fulvitalea axinellae TaxID=1182444 RepID=A0AAU9CR09_9BACT|nr:endonuclease V [Fulvitalea axinellae]
MIYAFDTYYFDKKAKTVCLGFKHWTDSEASVTLSETIASDEDYEPGAFYKKELPCIMNLLKRIDLLPEDLIVVDGYAILDDDGKIGLGGHLYEMLDRIVGVIGVAKTNFVRNQKNKREVFRGVSKNPLYISAIGTNLDQTSQNIKRMHGEHRIPTLLKKLDQLTRCF